MTSSGLIAPSSQQQNLSVKILDPVEPIESIEAEQSDIPTELDALAKRIIELQARINDLENLLKVIPELEKTIEGLENRCEDLENRKPTPGRPGPPGDITAALHNVERAAPELVKGELKKLWPEILLDLRDAMPALVEERLKSLQVTELRGERGPVGETGRDGRIGDRGSDGRNAVAPTRELVESLVVTALVESQLIDETRSHAGPILRFAVEEALEQALKMRIS
jgi:hypothetical protein